MQFIDVLIIAAFVAYAIGSGLWNRSRASRNLEEYFLAGRSLPGWQAGLSMAATQFAADTPLLVTGIIATAGIFALWQLWIYALAFLLMGFVLASSWRRAGVLTDAELSELRYGSRPAAALRAIKAIYFGTIFNCTVLAWVLFAAARIAEPFLRWERWLPPGVILPVAEFMQWINVPLTVGAPDDPQVWLRSASNLISILAILTVTAFYSTTGGLRSVVATDMVQIGVMLLGTLAFAVIVVDKVGGLGAIREQLYENFAAGGPGGILPGQILAFTPDQAKQASFALLFLFALQWLIQLNADGTGYLAQRSMACRSGRDAKQAALVFTFTQVLLRSLLWLPLGLGLLLLFPPDAALPAGLLQAERESTYVRGMAELLPPGVLGLMVTAMLAALASTVDTHINWGASYWTNDIFKRFICQQWLKREPSGRALVWVARGANLLILLIALLIMTQLSSINQAWQTSLLLGAGMGVVLILRWLWWRVNAWAEIAAVLVSLVAAPLLMLMMEDQALRLLSMAVLSTLAALAAMRIAGPEERGRLLEFYRRVRPPGYWGPIAEAAGDPAREGARRLWRALGAMAACGLSVFCLLVGLGSWLVGSPAPVWFPWETAWQFLLVMAGLALTPLWYKLGFGGEEEE
ncbi:MAG: Na+:solute symporter [SAR324 cluster bacterium]|nr:Na+:solute symporter [SAR324 cluster bacterium]